MIKVEKEPENLKNTLPETCIFCLSPGRWWEPIYNIPLCKEDAQSKTLKDVIRFVNRERK